MTDRSDPEQIRCPLCEFYVLHAPSECVVRTAASLAAWENEVGGGDD